MSRESVHQPRSNSPIDADPRLTVVSADRTEVRLADLPTVERDCTVTCASGDRTTATWVGVPVPELLSASDAPPETTHLRVVSDDGYAVCVAVGDALDALVALQRDGLRLADAEAYPTRFVGPGVAGERCVKGPVRIETHALAGEDDPEELEALALDQPGYG
jgi:DMSO/TMAO reductase YedYZ molybdopterin-dependent catalytic subunit